MDEVDECSGDHGRMGQIRHQSALNNAPPASRSPVAAWTASMSSTAGAEKPRHRGNPRARLISNEPRPFLRARGTSITAMRVQGTQTAYQPPEYTKAPPRPKSLQGLRLPSRDGGIRTRDPLNPIQVRYRAALRPVTDARRPPRTVFERNRPDDRTQPAPRLRSRWPGTAHRHAAPGQRKSPAAARTAGFMMGYASSSDSSVSTSSRATR